MKSGGSPLLIYHAFLLIHPDHCQWLWCQPAVNVLSRRWLHHTQARVEAWSLWDDSSTKALTNDTRLCPFVCCHKALGDVGGRGSGGVGAGGGMRLTPVVQGYMVQTAHNRYLFALIMSNSPFVHVDNAAGPNVHQVCSYLILRSWRFHVPVIKSLLLISYSPWMLCLNYKFYYSAEHFQVGPPTEDAWGS